MLFQTWFDYGWNKIHGHEWSKIIQNDFKMIQDQIKPQKIVKNIKSVDFEY